MRLINIGFGNMVSAERLLSVVSPESAPIKRIIQDTKERGALVNNHAHVLKFEEYATRRYVEMYINSIDLSYYITGAAQPKLNQKNLNKIEIPLPPLDEQKRIVELLDRFDTLCNDISTGLPAEIEARKKQYEYYRDTLLTFKRLEV